MPAGPVFDEQAILSTTVVGSGRRVVLVHGFTQTGRSWRAVARELERASEVTTIDLPGHGGSSTVIARDLDEAGRFVAMAGGRGTYVGYSMGGRIALHAAFAYPNLVERLVLVGASPGIPNAGPRRERLESDIALAERLDGSSGEELTIDAFLSEWLAGPLFSHLGVEAIGVDARRENTTSGLAQALRTLGTGTQIYDPGRIAALGMPVLVVAGELDDKFVALGRSFAELIGKNAQFESVRGVGHAAPFEDPSAFAALVEGWMQRTQS